MREPYIEAGNGSGGSGENAAHPCYERPCPDLPMEVPEYSSADCPPTHNERRTALDVLGNILLFGLGQTDREVMSTSYIDQRCPIPCGTGDLPSSATLDSIGGAVDAVAVPNGLPPYTTLSVAEREAITCAISLLYENLDLVQWASCLATGGDCALGDCLASKLGLFEDPILAGMLLPRVAVSHDVEVAFQSGYAGKYVAGSNTIALSRSVGAMWRSIEILDGIGADAWRNSDSYWCACADLAGLLLHELGHTCWASPGDSVFGGTCIVADLIETTLKWALANRFPEIANSACCEHFPNDKWFMAEDALTARPVKCVSSADGGGSGDGRVPPGAPDDPLRVPERL